MELGKYDESCILYRLYCFDRLLLCLHCLHMFACLMILFEDRSIKYAETFSIQCGIIILVICYSRKWYGFALIYTNLSHKFLLSLVWMKLLINRETMIWEELRRHKISSLGMPKAPQYNISRSLKHLSLGMPWLASHLSSSIMISQFWLSLSFCLFTWYVFCLEGHFILLVFSCCYLEQCFASFISIKVALIAFTMPMLQVYMLLFENRKFTAVAIIP